MCMCTCLLINILIYLNICIGRVAEGSISLTNICRELGMQILCQLLKSQIKIKQIKNLVT